MHHFESAGLGFGWNIFFHIDLAEGLAKGAIGRLHAALPARLDFLRAGQRLAAEVKILVDELFRESRSRGIHQLPSQVGFPIAEGSCSQLRVESFEKVRLADVDLLQLWMSGSLEV